MTPSAVSRSNAALASIPSSRATGTPRWVTTTSCPSRTRCSHSLRFARRSLMATSTPKAYRLCLTETYAPSMAPAWSASLAIGPSGRTFGGDSFAAGLRPKATTPRPERFEALAVAVSLGGALRVTMASCILSDASRVLGIDHEIWSLWRLPSTLRRGPTRHVQDTRDTKKTRNRGHQGSQGVTGGHNITPGHNPFFGSDLPRCQWPS